jgi:NAD dependent epimerase/dehydratase family enzyme
MVKGIHFLISQPSLHGPFNFTAPQPESNATFVKTLANSVNRPAFFPMPAPVLTLLMGESADLLLTGQYVFPEKLQQAGFVFSFPSLKGALTNLLTEK